MVRGLILVVLAVMLAGCATTPRYKGVAQGGKTENTLGVVVDAGLRVVAVDPDSAAERAGVQQGDVLVSLTWILSEAPAELPETSGVAQVGNSAPLTIAVTPMRPPPGVENKTFPFSDSEGIHTLIDYGVPLRLQLVRQDRVLELTVIPAPGNAENFSSSGAPDQQHF